MTLNRFRLIWKVVMVTWYPQCVVHVCCTCMYYVTAINPISGSAVVGEDISNKYAQQVQFNPGETLVPTMLNEI